MDAIGRIAKTVGGDVSSVGKVLSPLAPLATIGTGIAGTIGNAGANAMQNRALLQQLDLQKKYSDMTPDQFAAAIQSFQRPLSQGLTSGVGNLVQANMAERGLSQSPGVFSDVLAQALAPFQLQEQQMAGQQAMQALGLPIEAAGRFLPAPAKTSTADIWQQLMRQLGIGGGTVKSPNVTTGVSAGTPTAGSSSPTASGGYTTYPDTGLVQPDDSNNWMDWADPNPAYGTDGYR